jgi:uncharacterized protein YggU (UPF0235/DUF167 family)
LSGETSPRLIPRLCDGGVALAVRLTPKSAKDEIKGVESFANHALEKLIANWLGVPASSVSVAHGGKSRLKQVKIEGDANRLSQLVAEKLAAL